MIHPFNSEKTTMSLKKNFDWVHCHPHMPQPSSHQVVHPPKLHMQPWHWQDPLLLRSIHPWCHGRPPPPWERFPIWKCDHLSPLLNPKPTVFWDLDHPKNLEPGVLEGKMYFFWILVSMFFQGNLIILHQAENGRGSKSLDPKMDLPMLNMIRFCHIFFCPLNCFDPRTKITFREISGRFFERDPHIILI